MTKQPRAQSFMTEFGVEPVPGLPKSLPQDDRILWQGAPHWYSFARRVFHVNKIAAWFMILAAWRMGVTVNDGGSPVEALLPIVILLAIGGAAISFFLFVAWMVQRTTIYTLTRERLIMRVGIALPITVNIPYGLIDSAGLKTFSDGTGNIPLKLNAKDRASYVMLWPHVRPWQITSPQPMLRCIPDAKTVAGILSDALPDFFTRQEAGAFGEVSERSAPTKAAGKRRAATQAERAEGVALPGAAAG